MKRNGRPRSRKQFEPIITLPEMENHVYHPVKHLFPWDPIRNRVKFPILISSL